MTDPFAMPPVGMPTAQRPFSLAGFNPSPPFQPPPAPKLSPVPPVPPMPTIQGMNPQGFGSPMGQQLQGGIGQGLGYDIASQLFGQMFPQAQASPGAGSATAVPTPTPTASPSTTPPATPSPGATSNQAVDSSSPQAFVRSLSSTAQQVSQQTGIPANILLAIAANETGWGQDVVGNNYMGIKGTGPAGSNVSPTWEVQNGQAVNTSDAFRGYSSAGQSLADFATFLQQNPRYGPALQYLRSTGDPAGFIRQVNQAGYATDPNWSDKILAIAQTIPSYLGSG